MGEDWHEVQTNESKKVEEKQKPIVTSPGKGHEDTHEVQTDESTKVEEKQKPIVTSPSKEAETSERQDEEKIKATEDDTTSKAQVQPKENDKVGGDSVIDKAENKKLEAEDNKVTQPIDD